MIANRDSIARFKSDLYRNGYYRVVNIMLLESVLILLLSIAIVYFVFLQPTPKYYAATSEGQVISMTAAKQ
jgi:hypothetical protein